METTSPTESKETGHSLDRIHAGKVYGLRKYIDTEGQGKPYKLCTAQPIGGPYAVLLTKNLGTSRLTLHSWWKPDKDFTLSSQGDRENGKYMSGPVREGADETYLKCVDGMEDSPEGYYLLAERKADVVPVGARCIFPENGNYDIGYCAAKEYWKEGFGTEMVGVILRWVRAKSGGPVTGGVVDGNFPPIVLLRKLGFTENRKTRYKGWSGETYFDAHYYKLSLDRPPISLQCWLYRQQERKPPSLREVTRFRDELVAFRALLGCRSCDRQGSGGSRGALRQI